MKDVVFIRKKDKKKLNVPKWFLEGTFKSDIVFLDDNDFYGIHLPMKWLLNSVPYFWAYDCIIEHK